MADVLVLNASYQPLSVVSSRRAVVLIVSDKAVPLSELDGSVVRSESLTVIVPSVVRLTRFVKQPPHRRTNLSRKAVLHRDRHRCAYCDARSANTVDHVVPRSRGGVHAWTNVVAACQTCNSRKGSRLVSELGWTLKRRPHEPPPGSWLILNREQVADDWEPWLSRAA